MLTQQISAHRATVQKFVNTRRSSTQRSFVLLCGVSSEVLGQVCRGKAAAGVAGGIYQLDFTVVLHLPCQKILAQLTENHACITQMVLPSWWEMANRWVSVARNFVHQNEKMFWSSTKLKVCLLEEPEVANVLVVWSEKRLMILSYLHVSTANHAASPVEVIQTRDSKNFSKF